MDILSLTSRLLTVCGFSRPPSWKTPLKKFLYNFYSICLILIVQALVITEFLDLVFNVDNPENFSDNIYVTLEMIVIWFKMCSLLIKRKNIAILIDTFQRTPFATTDSQEIEIRTRFDKTVEWNTKLYTFVLGLCVIWTILATLVAATTSRELLFRAWLPFDYSSTITFYSALGFQILCAMIGSISNVACDSLFSGLLIHIYCQFEILGHRLKNILENENDLVKQCNRHHDQIYKLVSQFRRVTNIRSSEYENLFDERFK
ncbi:uncharacterized protein LOC143348394 [Colletes latitarsis]|uniref:uncharacterized protein LOC143348394 n=1 Tax=Colletes latitarsis TaxID=2605962 RepID=UPI004035CDF0